MKTLLLILAAVVTASASAQQSSPPPLVSTTGSAQIRVVPDLADLCFEVEVRNVDLDTARKQQNERAIRVLASLRKAGIPAADLQSSQLQITPDYTDRRQESDKIKFWSVAQSISCTLHDVGKVPDVTAATVAAGATRVRDAVLRTSQLRKYRDEARAAAIRAAKEKAEALADELESHIGKPYTIKEESGQSWNPSFNNSIQTPSIADGQQGDNATPAFAPGTISISASVSVSFLLE